MIILFTTNNEASLNIAKQLIENYGFERKTETQDYKNMKIWEYDGHRLIETNAPSVLDIPTDFDTELILVLSSHKSKNGGKMLTAHFPGNWNEAKYGGTPKTLNIACANKLKLLLQEMDHANKQLGWPLVMEVDHHGPTCEVPIIFVEIGSTEEEWKNEDAAKVVAEAVSSFIAKYKTQDSKLETENRELETKDSKHKTGNRVPKTVLGVGGGHYAKEFTERVLDPKKDIAIGHIIPKYAIDELEIETFRQAIEKTEENVTKILVLKEGTNSSQKKKIIKFAEACELGLEMC